MPHPESKSTLTFSDFPPFRGIWDFQFFKMKEHRLQKIDHRIRKSFAGMFPRGSIVLNKVLVQIDLGNFEKSASEPSGGTKKVPKKIFEADFGGLAVISRP